MNDVSDDSVSVIPALAAHLLRVPENNVSTERMATDASTWVFRVRYHGDIFYLRILPEVGVSFVPEVAAHQTMLQRGVHVPDVIAFEDCAESIQRSVMLTTAIAGRPASAHPAGVDTPAILVAAGRDLARINSIPVTDFGWVRRDRPDTAQIVATWPTHRAFALENWGADLAYLAKEILRADEIAALDSILASHDTWLVQVGGKKDVVRSEKGTEEREQEKCGDQSQRSWY